MLTSPKRPRHTHRDCVPHRGPVFPKWTYLKTGDTLRRQLHLGPCSSQLLVEEESLRSELTGRL